MLRYRLELEVKEKIGVVILESRTASQSVSWTGAMLVPRGREKDWVFASESGQRQLLTVSGAFRLVLFSRPGTHSDREGDDPAIGEEWKYVDEQHSDETLQQRLRPLLTQFGEEVEVPFVCYEDGVIWRKIVDMVTSRLTGTMLVEDVRLESGDLRRRLRFKETPNLIQTDVSVLVDEAGQFKEVDHSVLVHVYLAPLVAGLSLVSWTLETCAVTTGTARVLCVGMGGGALPMFLSKNMKELHVEAVDWDEAVIDVARRRFGLVEGNNLEVRVENGLTRVVRLAEEATVVNHVQAIILDVSAGDGLTCPPPAFVDGSFLTAVRSALDPGGVFAVNFIPGSTTSHHGIIKAMANFFEEVYEIEVSDGENFAVFALPSSCRQTDGTCDMFRKIRSLVGDELIDMIRRVA